MLKRLAMIFGVIFILIGVAGFIEALAPGADTGDHAMLFGLFAVDPIHNWVHILSGVAALVAGFMSEGASRAYFRIFGVVYAAVTILGLFVGRGEMLGIMANNFADVGLHLVIATAALLLGFSDRLSRDPGDRHHPA